MPADPNELRKLPRLLRAVAWRLPLEYGEWRARTTYRPFDRCVDVSRLAEFIPERGNEIEGTSVTIGQREILLRALKKTTGLPQAIAEIGAWRGVTTAALAERTPKRIYAVDPHRPDEFPGINEAFDDFRRCIAPLPNVVHVRLSSGAAARQLADEQLSLVFVDAIHDYVNTWHDFVVWGRRLVPGGIIALHDVDDHPGTNRAARRILRTSGYRPWGYCPNMIAFEKTA